jgi:hypothetical protein
MPNLSKPQWSNLLGEYVYFWNGIEVRGSFETVLQARQDQLERLRELDRIESEEV